MKLEAQDIACDRGGHPIFTGVSFALEPGRLLVLSGPNGAGKSSLLRLIAGLGRPVEGAILADGADIAGDRAAFARRVVYVGHQDALKPSLSVVENLSFWAGLQRGRPVPAGEMDRALDLLGLAMLRDVPARFLSAGQRRRAALARAFASDAALWLLDEPTNALDADSLTAFEGGLTTHLDAGGSAIVSAHVPVGGGRGQVLTLRAQEPGSTDDMEHSA